MSKKQEKMVILDLTRRTCIPTIPAYHDSPEAEVFEFWTEQNEGVNSIERIKHDTQKIVIKTNKGVQSLTIPKNMQTNLLEYFKFKNKGVFKKFTCNELIYYMVHGSIDKVSKYKIKKTNEFEIGDTILLGKFKKIFWKTFTIAVEHSAICIAQTKEGPLFISKLGNKELVVVTTLSELQKIYWCTSSCAKTIWKN